MELTKRSDRLGTESIIPLLFKLSVPAIIGMLIQSLYNIVEHVLLITLFFSEVVTLIGVFFTNNLMNLFTDNLFLADLAETYIQIILIGSLAFKECFF